MKPINLILIVVLLLILAGGGYYTVVNGQKLFETIKQEAEISTKLREAKDKLDLLKAEKENKPKEENKTDKVIFESTEPGIGAEASFAPLFERFIETAKLSGIRIRSINYNYNPIDDSIVAAKLTNYNVCELDVKAVGSYRNFQTFYKALNRDNYVMSLAQMEFKPWEGDRSVLVSDFKLRLYTKTN